MAAIVVLLSIKLWRERIRKQCSRNCVLLRILPDDILYRMQTSTYNAIDAIDAIDVVIFLATVGLIDAHRGVRGIKGVETGPPGKFSKKLLIKMQ